MACNGQGLVLAVEIAEERGTLARVGPALGFQSQGRASWQGRAALPGRHVQARRVPGHAAGPVPCSAAAGRAPLPVLHRPPVVAGRGCPLLPGSPQVSAESELQRRTALLVLASRYVRTVTTAADSLLFVNDFDGAGKRGVPGESLTFAGEGVDAQQCQCVADMWL